jgi:hypothetical protein
VHQLIDRGVPAVTPTGGDTTTHPPTEEPTLAPIQPKSRAMTTQAELAAALTETFLGNADVGDHAANDQLIAALGAWQRQRRCR